MSYLKNKRLSFKPFPENATIAEKLAHQVDELDTYDWEFRREILRDLPEGVDIKVSERYCELHKSKGRREANLYFLDVKDNLNSFALSLSTSDEELIQYAELISRDCFYQWMRLGDSKTCLLFLSGYIKQRLKINITKIFHLDPDTFLPKSRSLRYVTIDGVMNRLCDPLCWRRALRKTISRGAEKLSIDTGLVHRRAGIYLSEGSMKRIREQRIRNRKALEHTTLVNELDEEFSLAELVEKSLANPANRRAELMVRIRGTEERSKLLNHSAAFLTITCPSKMHARLSKSGDPNPKYEQANSPRIAQQYLSTLFKRIRAKLARLGLEYYGFRVVEPHHDGTPHWHLLLFMPADEINTLVDVFREYALREDGEEDGAAEHRFKYEIINPNKGSATGYIAKYISKNIDGYGVDNDLYGYDAKDSAKRINSWSSLWGIRQFQQLGGPPVGVYRELRRINGGDLNGTLFEIWEAADKGDWERFVKLMGGPKITRNECPIKISRLWSDEPNRFREPKGYRIVGVTYENITIGTRIHQWKIKQKPEKKFRYEDLINDNPCNEGVSSDLDPNEGRALAPLEFCQ